MRVNSVAAIAGLLMTPVFAQDKASGPEPAVYKVEFNIRESSGAAAKTSRRYVMLIDAGERKGSFRVGAKVPYTTGSFSAGQSGVSPLVSTQYSYAEVGVNIDAHLREVNGKIDLTADLDLTSLVQHDKGAAANPPAPTIAQSRIGINALIQTGKPSLVASVDDPLTLRVFDIEVTVTKVN